MTVSIIIPVYNAQDYLNQCLKSVLDQSFAGYEVLLIDDGSTDKSLEICQKFAEMDDRISVFHQKNGGVSSARNLGLDRAKGDWIIFVDSDDIIMKDYVTDLVTEGKSGNFVYQSSVRKCVKNHSVEDFITFSSDEVLSIEDFFKRYYVGRYGYVWGKIFKKDIIEDRSLRFAEDVDISEDNLFILEYLKSVDFIRLSRTKNYVYLARENSLVKKKYPYQQELQLLDSAKKRLDSLCAAHQIKPKYGSKELQYLLHRAVDALYDGSNTNTRQKLKKLFKKYRSVFDIAYTPKATGRAYLAWLSIRFENVYFLDQIFSKLIMRP